MLRAMLGTLVPDLQEKVRRNAAFTAPQLGRWIHFNHPAHRADEIAQSTGAAALLSLKQHGSRPVSVSVNVLRVNTKGKYQTC